MPWRSRRVKEVQHYSYFNLGTRWVWRSTPRPLYQPGKDSVSTVILRPAPSSWVLLEKLTGYQLVKKFPFYGTRRFITAFTSACHLSLSSASSIQSVPQHPTSWRSFLISSSHLSQCVPSGLFPSGFPSKTLYTPLLSPIRATCPAHLILLDFITRMTSRNN